MGVAQVNNQLWLCLIILSISSVTGAELNCIYTAFVRTGTYWGSGTDSKITLSLYDATGHGLRIKNLEAWGGLMDQGYDYFEMDSLDMFSGRGPCLNGPICKMNLTSDGTGKHTDWYVNYVEVTSTGGHNRCYQEQFSVEGWIGPTYYPDGLTKIKNNCRRVSIDEQHHTYDSVVDVNVNVI